VVSAINRALFFCDLRISFGKLRAQRLRVPWITRCKWRSRMRGFSLLEVLVATTIVIVGVAALAQLVALAAHANLQAKQTTIAAAIAQDKIEALLPDIAVGQEASPPDTLGHNVDGYCDFVDTAGRPLGAGPATPAGSAYLRRWSVDPLPDSSNHTSILQVLVADLRGRIIVRFVAASSGRAS
jgi:type II secretory pathway pseudopilin PulG